MKKRFITICLTFVIALSGLALVACGDDSSDVNPYESYQTTLASMRENTTLFKNGTTDYGMESDFYLNNFYDKNAEGSKVEGNQNYIFLTAYGLNYINKYYTYLSDLSGYDFSGLNSALESLTGYLPVIDLASENIVSADQIANISVYRSYFVEYETNAKEFINIVFDNALALSDFLINERGLTAGLGTEAQTQEQITFYIENEILYAINDVRVILMESAKGKVLTGNDIYDGAVKLLSYYGGLVTNNSYITPITVETMAGAINLSNLLAGERATTRKASASFSIYDYEADNNILLDGDNRAYYAQLQKYYSMDNNFLQQYYNYLATNIYE